MFLGRLIMLDPNGSNHKLEKAAKEFLLQCLAEYWRPENIFSELKRQFGVKKYSKQALDYYKKRYPKEISRKRKKWLKDLESIDLAQKKVRIMKLTDMYYDLDKKKLSLSTEEIIKLRQSLLEQIRRELEPAGKLGTTDEPLVIRVMEEHIGS